MPLAHPHFHLAPLALAVTLALAAPGITHAQAAAGSTQAVTLSIAAQPLASALNELSAATGTAIGFSPALVAGKTARAVKGELTVRQAVDQMLSGSGLVAVQEGGGIVIQQAKSDEVAVLAPVTVTASGWNGVTENTGSYAQTGPSSTATGLRLTLRETPQSVTVVTRQKMDDFNQQTLKDVMSQTPGISVVSLGADETHFYARGERIHNFQMDGSRSGQGTGRLGNPGATSLSSDDLAEMDRIEVLKGSAGLLQGDGYPSATVNMIRKKPTREFQASIGASVGSWDTYRTDVDISGPLTESGNIRGRAVAAYKDANSYRDNVQNRNALFYGTLDFDLTPDTLLNISVDYKERQNRGDAGNSAPRAYYSDGSPQEGGWVSRSWNAGAPWAGYDEKTLTTQATLEHRFANGWETKLHLSHDKSEIPDWMRAAATPPEYANTFYRFKNLENRTKNVSLDIKGNFDLFGRTHELLVGADFSRNNYQMDTWRPSEEYRTSSEYLNFLKDPITYVNQGGSLYPKAENYDLHYLTRADTLRRGAYFTTRLNLSDDMKLILGSRVSDYIYNYTYRNVYQGANALWGNTHTREKGVITPYGGLVYDLNRNFSLYGSYAEVFQPVNAQDESGNTLDPQKGVTYEIGTKAEFYDGRLNASLAYFWKRWENTYEASGGQTPTGGTAYRNVNGVMERGYELEISGELAPGWQAQVGYVMNNSELINDGYYVLPKHQFKLNTSYRLSGALRGLTIGAGARWQSKIHTFGNSPDVRLEQQAYWLFDFMARYKINKNLTAGININNLFDKKYFSSIYNSPNYAFNGMFYTWGEPRNVTVSLRYVF